jgi:hypothetical protein
MAASPCTLPFVKSFVDPFVKVVGVRIPCDPSPGPLSGLATVRCVSRHACTAFRTSPLSSCRQNACGHRIYRKWLPALQIFHFSAEEKDSAISALKFAVLEGTVMTHQFVLAHEMMAHASPRNDEASKRHIHGHKSNNALTLTVA